VKSRVMTSSVISRNFLVSASKSGKVSTEKVMRESKMQYLYRPIEHPTRQGIIALDDCSQVHGELLVSLTVISTWPGLEPLSARLGSDNRLGTNRNQNLVSTLRRAKGTLENSRYPEAFEASGKIPDMKSLYGFHKIRKGFLPVGAEMATLPSRVPRRIRRYLEKSVVIQKLSCEERKFGKKSTTIH